MAKNPRQAFDPARAVRQSYVDNAIASVRIEGLEPTDSAKAIFARYVDGDIGADQMSSEIRALNAREFRPIPVPGD
jgi:hypothetical protein